MSLLNIFANNLLPILLLSGAGFALGSALNLDSRPLGRVIFYILSPVLIFNLLTSSKLVVETIVLLMGFLASVMLPHRRDCLRVGQVFSPGTPPLTVVVLTTLFSNNGNYGLPLISFAFGQEALAYASIYFVTNSLMLYTIGCVDRQPWSFAVERSTPWALESSRRSMPSSLLSFLSAPGGFYQYRSRRTVTLTAGGAVPAMIILLGLELQKVEWTHNVRALSIPVICRLLIGPVIGLAAGGAFWVE